MFRALSQFIVCALSYLISPLLQAHVSVLVSEDGGIAARGRPRAVSSHGHFGLVPGQRRARAGSLAEAHVGVSNLRPRGSLIGKC